LEDVPNMSLKINHLSGGYTRKKILKDVNFEINDGEIVGLIGLNGAGKSTTIKHIMGLMTPFEGEILLNNQTIKNNSEQYRSQIGFVPEAPLLYEELTLREHIEITAMSYNIDVKVAMERSELLLDLFRLTDRLEWFPSDFSKGMKQKVMIVCAFIIEPSLFVIDEPFIGLDPLAISDLLDIIEERRQAGSSVLMSTHVLANAEKICDSFVILHDGEVYAKGTLEELKETMNVPKSANLDEIYRKLAAERGIK